MYVYIYIYIYRRRTLLHTRERGNVRNETPPPPTPTVSDTAARTCARRGHIYIRLPQLLRRVPARPRAQVQEV